MHLQTVHCIRAGVKIAKVSDFKREAMYKVLRKSYLYILMYCILSYTFQTFNGLLMLFIFSGL